MISPADALLQVRSEDSLQNATTTLVGSSYVLGSGKDVDVLALVDMQGPAVGKLRLQGWDLDGSDAYDTSFFTSLRKGDINLIVTGDPAYYKGTVRAADVCKFLQVTCKAQRIQIHEMIRDGRSLDSYCILD